MNGWHSLLEVMAHGYTSLFTRGIRATGLEHITPGPKIIIANHPDATAIFALPRLFPDRLCFLAQSDLFDLPVVGRWLGRAGHVPVVHGQPAQTFALAAQRLAEGYAIALCPEGRISPQGRLSRAHTGAVRNSNSRLTAQFTSPQIAHSTSTGQCSSPLASHMPPATRSGCVSMLNTRSSPRWCLKMCV